MPAYRYLVITPYQAWGDTCIGCRKTRRPQPRVPSGDQCHACKGRVYAAERLVAAGELQ